MDFILNDVEVRVLGALLEKSYTTPEYYPLSLNSLQNACNQKSNRNPVVAFDEKTVVRGVEGLKGKKIAVQSDSGRVVKYAENFVSLLNLVTREAAILCLLFLRGPQTIGELRGRSERIHAFEDTTEVEEVLETLLESGYVVKLPKQPGRKENRYVHLFAGKPEVEEETGQAKAAPAVLEVLAENERIRNLEKQVVNLQKQLADLQAQFLIFKSEFE
jgi:hypothetical protein